MIQFISNCIQKLRHYRNLRKNRGTAIVELALVLSIFGLPTLLGTADTSTFIFGSIEISNAAHAGAMYGMMSSNVATDTAGITSTAKADAPDIPAANVTVTPTSYYACSAAQGGVQYTGIGNQATAAALSSATSACTGTGNYPLEFVRVLLSAPVTLPFHCCGIPATITLNSQSVMEVY
jgi:Flp pilus assembly protein TadG